MRIKRGTAWLLAVLFLVPFCWAAGAASDKTADIKNSVLEYIATETPEPTFSPVGGEWAVLSLARGGFYAADSAYFAAYEQRVAAVVKSIALPNGALHRAKSTDNARLILALTAIGKNPRRVGGTDLLNPYTDFEWIGKQGINGIAFALLALDSRPYEKGFSQMRRQCVDALLAKQTTDGGWTLSGQTADPDLTAMVLQALARYADETAVAAAAKRGFAALSKMQKTDGAFAESCESIAQVVIACAAWGIDPDTDARFVKANSSAWQALRAFYLPKTHAFLHLKKDTAPDAMATEQAAYAIVAYDRFLNEKTALYDMSDVFSGAVAPSQTTTDGWTSAPAQPTGTTQWTTAPSWTSSQSTDATTWTSAQEQTTGTKPTTQAPSAAQTTINGTANCVRRPSDVSQHDLPTLESTTKESTTKETTTIESTTAPVSATSAAATGPAVTPNTGDARQALAAAAVLVLAMAGGGVCLLRKRGTR